MKAEDRRATWSWRERLRREKQERKDSQRIISNRRDEFAQRDEYDARLRKRGIDPVTGEKLR